MLKRAAADPAEAEAIKALAGTEGTLGGTPSRLFALAESYPDLKANQNMIEFQEELASTENKVAFARQAFNDAVMSYNNASENFPNSVIAKNFNFKHAEFLGIEHEEKREVPKVSLTRWACGGPDSRLWTPSPNKNERVHRRRSWSYCSCLL